MNETVRLISDSADRLFEEALDHTAREVAETGAWSADLWQAVEEAGYTQAWDETDTESREMALALAHRAGWHAVPVPLAETMVARHLLAGHGFQPPDGPLTIADPCLLEGVALDGQQVSGAAARVAYGRHAAGVVTVINGIVVLAPATVVSEGANMAAEPRDTIDWQGEAVRVGETLPAGQLRAAGALVRAAQTCGALQHALAKATQYAGERKQFGRPLGKFQAIQHYLARIAGLTATAEAALARATAAPDHANIAAAKSCASEAAGEVATLAHQIHGAIGFTREHSLHHITRRLLSWRDEFGAEAWWQEQLGGLVTNAGAGRLWPLIVAEG